LFTQARKFLYVAMVLGAITRNERSNNKDNMAEIAGSKQQETSDTNFYLTAPGSDGGPTQ
jgi:hypothetical protein